MAGHPSIRALSATIAVAFALGSFASACGGGGASKVEAQEWVEQVCDAFADYEDDHSDLRSAVSDIDFSNEDDAHEDYVEILEDQAQLAEGLLEQLAEVGEPDVEDGAEIRDFMLEAVAALHSDFEEAAEEVAALDADELNDEGADLINALDAFDFEDELDDLGRDIDSADDVHDLVEDEGDCAFDAWLIPVSAPFTDE